MTGIQEKVRTNDRLAYALLAGITLLAAILRFYKLGQWSFWIDEIYTINRAIGHFNLEMLIDKWWQPPLSVILTGAVFQVAGVSEWSARLVPALIGVVSIPILYWIVKDLCDPWTALIAAFLLAIAPWHIFWSQNARFYTSLMLFYFLASAAFFLFIERGRPKYLVFFVAASFFAISERYTAILILPVLLVYLITIWLLSPRQLTRYSYKTYGLLALPVLAYGLMEIYSVATTGVTRIGYTIETFVGRPIDNPIRIAILIFFNLGIPLAALSMFSGYRILSQKNRFGIFFLISAVVPLVSTLVLSQFSFVVDRYVFMTLPSWIILAAYGITRIQESVRTSSIALGLALLMIFAADSAGTSLMYYQINHGNRPDWRQAFQFAVDQMDENDILVSSVPNVGEYYTKRQVLPLAELHPEQLTEKSQRAWFVLDSENAWFAPENKQWVEAHADLLTVSYLRVREEINLKVYVYQNGYQKP